MFTVTQFRKHTGFVISTILIKTEGRLEVTDSHVNYKHGGNISETGKRRCYCRPVIGSDNQNSGNCNDLE